MVNVSLEELARRHADLQREVDEDRLVTHARVRDLELWRAEARGSIRTLMWVVSLGLGLPTTILGVIALFMYGGA